MALSTSRRYSVASISPTHGAEQRLIWCCRQGRVRLAKNESSQPHPEQLLDVGQGLAHGRAVRERPEEAAGHLARAAVRT